MEITATGTAHEHAHSGGHDHAHEELGFLRTWVFSLDHKVIGMQYAVTGLLFLLFGFTLMMIMRFQMAYPGHPIPVIGDWFGAANAPGGILLPEFYNQLGAMHGTIMVFLGVVPLAVGGFGNFVMPLQIGAPDMAFPKLNMMSYWVYFCGGMTMLASFVLPGDAVHQLQHTGGFERRKREQQQERRHELRPDEERQAHVAEALRPQLHDRHDEVH